MLAADLPATGHSLPQLLRNHGYATGSEAITPPPTKFARLGRILAALEQLSPLPKAIPAA